MGRFSCINTAPRPVSGASLKLQVRETSTYEVTVGDGHKVKGKGMCKKLLVEIQGVMVVQDFYLFELEGVNMILGIEWLESLGEVRVNWRQLMMKYKEGDEYVCLTGDSSLARTEVSLSTMMKTVRKGGQGFVIELNRVEGQPIDSHKAVSIISPDIQRILDNFSEVCMPLQGLPPPRSRDHAILVKEDVTYSLTSLDSRLGRPRMNGESSRGGDETRVSKGSWSPVAVQQLKVTATTPATFDAGGWKQEASFLLSPSLVIYEEAWVKIRDFENEEDKGFCGLQVVAETPASKGCKGVSTTCSQVTVDF
ncbi:Retrotransposable element Tf2 [Senna tora]|uniref:Retrotransposable element Tf2 n=1 Tax=Senna tora TaxID=362788 RepID=A0A834WKS2_9FABA|nr:Retrotransposable element Tf2 [Senna tora]